MAEAQILYMGTSKAVEIKNKTSLLYTWGDAGKWTTLKTPKAFKTTTVKYSKKQGNTRGSIGSWTAGDGKEHFGTMIPKTKTRTVEGVERVCNVQYQFSGYTKYTKTKALKAKKKMKKSTYTVEKPYQYRLRYEEKPVAGQKYSKFENAMSIFYFNSFYYDSSGNLVETESHLPHPVSVSMTYSDVRRNLDTSNSIASDGRDNSGKYVLSNVRANVVTLNLTWQGIEEDDGEVILQILNPTAKVDSQGKTTSSYNYITMQYLDPATGKAANGTFFASSERTVTKYSSGIFKEITVTLMEV